MKDRLPDIPRFSLEKELYLSKHPYEYNVFIMMKYDTDEYHTLVEASVRNAFKDFGLFNPVFAKDLTPDYFPTLTDAITESIDMCSYGIAVLTPQPGTQFNPNVAFEMGIMWPQKSKKMLILKDRRVPALFTNIAGLSYVGFNGELQDLRADANQLREVIMRWLGKMKEHYRISLDYVFITGLQNIIDNPAVAIEYFEKQMWECTKVVAEYAHTPLPQTDDLPKAIKFLYDEHHITYFIRAVMLKCVKLCRQLKGARQLSVEQRTELLGWAALVRDIYNDWLRHYQHFLDLR